MPARHPPFFPSFFLHSFFDTHSYLLFLSVFLMVSSLPLSYHDVVCTGGSFISLPRCRYKGVLILNRCKNVQEPPFNKLQSLLFTSPCLSSPPFFCPWYFIIQTCAAFSFHLQTKYYFLFFLSFFSCLAACLPPCPTPFFLPLCIACQFFINFNFNIKLSPTLSRVFKTFTFLLPKMHKDTFFQCRIFVICSEGKPLADSLSTSGKLKAKLKCRNTSVTHFLFCAPLLEVPLLHTLGLCHSQFLVCMVFLFVCCGVLCREEKPRALGSVLWMRLINTLMSWQNKCWTLLCSTPQWTLGCNAFWSFVNCFVLVFFHFRQCT